MKLIIAGCRDFHDFSILVTAMRTYLETHPRPDEIVSGAAAGADALGERWAAENAIPVRRFPAEWQKYGYSAGPRRNEAMSLYADALLLLWDGRSRGSANMLMNMKQLKKPYEVVHIGKPDER